jgi:hypothetical protein
VLYGYVSRLRATLADVTERADTPGAGIVWRSGGCVLAVEPESVYLHRFRRLAGEAKKTGYPDLMDGIHQLADLGYVGVDGIDLVPIKRLPGQELHEKAKDDNRVPSSIRAAVERAVAHVKTWRMLSEEGGRFRPPIQKFPEMLAAAWGLINLKRYMIVAYG